MKVKLIVMALAVAGTVFGTACDKVGYTCEGTGTCDDPKFCLNSTTLASYWEVNGQEFSTYDELYDICQY